MKTAVMEEVPAGGTSRAEVPVAPRPAIRAVIEDPDPRRRIERYAATQPGIHRRAGPLLRVLLGAVATDPELTALVEEMEAWRFEGQGRLVGLLAEQGHLRPGLQPDVARDIVWTLCSLQVHDLLVVGRRWTSDRYRDWLAVALERVLWPVRSPHSQSSWSIPPFTGDLLRVRAR